MHNASKILMGSTQSSYKAVDNKAGTIAAGTAVRLKSDDSISVALTDGSLLGISLGSTLSDIARTNVVRKGTKVPVLLTAAFDPVIGAVVYISDTTGLAIASGAGATATAAVYASGRVGGTGVNGGVNEAGADVGVALIDMPGGL